jgi:hypothetical protein
MDNLVLYAYENTTPKKNTGKFVDLKFLEAFCSENSITRNTFLEKHNITIAHFIFAIEAHSPFYFVSIEEYEEEKREDGYDEDYLTEMVKNYRIEYDQNTKRESLFFDPNDIVDFFVNNENIIFDLIETFGYDSKLEINKTLYKQFLDFLKDACANGYLIQSEWN